MTAVVVPAPKGKDTAARQKRRGALIEVLFDGNGRRKLPRERDLAAAIDACGAEDTWWVCEANSYGPLYFLPTREWLGELVALVDSLKAKSVLEVGAGDGFLSFCLSRRRPDLKVTATDDFSWTKPSARQNDDDRAEFDGVAFAGIRPMAHVVKHGAVAAVTALRPDLVLCAWPPPGTLVERVIRAPSKHVVDISVDGDVCGNGEKTWRFEKEFLSGPLEDRGLCRLDGDGPRQTRCTLYFGARHRRHGVDKSMGTPAAGGLRADKSGGLVFG